MKVRGHNLAWWTFNPDWLDMFAQTATPAAMSQLQREHIFTVMRHYQGKVFAWDVVNEAVSDSATRVGTQLRDEIWYDQPGVGLKGAAGLNKRSVGHERLTRPRCFSTMTTIFYACGKTQAVLI